ncbi:MAG: peptidoglycan DD-metalloendopeptidase family protein [Patescibacteria group bacterium]
MKAKASVVAIVLTIIFSQTAKAEQGFLYLPIKDKAIMTCDFCCYRYKDGSCHDAIDYDTTDSATKVYAAGDGEVLTRIQASDAVCKKLPYGNHIIIRHSNGYLTLYAHLKYGTILVSKGNKVSAGQEIATADNTGCSSGSHLHFEVRDSKGNKVNPYGDPPDYKNGCGTNPLWATCPPTPYEPPQDVDADNDGFLASQGDCNDQDASINPTAKEVCDTRDNDCNGETDELFKDPLIKATAAALGKPCVVGKGACAREGSMVCTADGKATVCSVDASKPSTELCDGKDNDCDGKTDEDWKKGLASDLGKPCTVGKGGCARNGEMVCTGDGLATACSADAGKPIAEVCDTKDNDCDGQIDENTDVDCQDGIFCNGSEECLNGACKRGEPFICPEQDTACVYFTCEDGQRGCISNPKVISCTGKQCGDDGCGGSCGECVSGKICTAQGTCANASPQCPSIMDCGSRDCGPDPVCGESCGECVNPPLPLCADSVTLRTFSVPASCAQGVCQYSISDMVCASGCQNGQCQNCTPSCVGKQCGTDGCGGSCGTCDDGFVCTTDDCDLNGQCQNVSDSVICNDGKFCNGVESCDITLACVPGDPPDCSALNDQCHIGVCDLEQDACKAVSRPNGTVCVDGTQCASVASCNSGVCTGVADKDSDNDGFVEKVCGGEDCDDSTNLVSPTRSEDLQSFHTVTPYTSGVCGPLMAGGYARAMTVVNGEVYAVARGMPMTDLVFMYADVDGTASSEAVATNNDSASGVAIAVTGTGETHICYTANLAPNDKRIMYAFRDASWSSWTYDEVDNSNYQVNCDIKVDVWGGVHLAYDKQMFSGEDGQWYAYRDSGGYWSKSETYAANHFARLALKPGTSEPHLCMVTGPATLHLWKTGGTWYQEQVDAFGVGCAIAFDHSGSTVFIAYHETGDGGKFRIASSTGGSWNIRSALGEIYPTLSVDDLGFFHMTSNRGTSLLYTTNREDQPGVVPPQDFRKDLFSIFYDWKAFYPSVVAENGLYLWALGYEYSSCGGSTYNVRYTLQQWSWYDSVDSDCNGNDVP